MIDISLILNGNPSNNGFLEHNKWGRVSKREKKYQSQMKRHFFLKRQLLKQKLHRDVLVDLQIDID